MTKKYILRNVKTLESIRDAKQGRVSNEIMERINVVVELYRDRKISQMDTAINLIQSISTGTQKEKIKALQKYDKVVGKYEKLAPIGERMKEVVAKARKGAKKAHTTRKLNKEIGEDAVKKAGKIITKKLKPEKKGAYSVKYMLFSLENRTGAKRRSFTMDGRNYYTLLTNPAERHANIKAPEWIEQRVKQKITKSQGGNMSKTNPLYKKMMMLMRSDFEFNEMLNGEFYYYIDAIRIESIEKIDEEGVEFNVFDDELTNTERNSIYHRYVSTEVDLQYLTLKEAIKNTSDVKNECWINALRKHYGETLMRPKRGSLAKNMTRENILKLIGMTNEEFSTKGASINQMIKVFQEYHLPVRLYNVDSKLIYKYDDENYHSKKIPTFNGLIKNSHIYVLNNNLNSLKRSEEKEGNAFYVSNNYKINNKTEPLKIMMIKGVDDLLKLNEYDEYKLILEDNDLNKFASDLVDAGYDPYVRFPAGRMYEIRVSLKFEIEEKKFKEVKYSIMSQHLSEHKIDEDIWVDTESKYNKVNEAMFKFNKNFFAKLISRITTKLM